jgi:NarL family two-component system response regulator LiaR
MGVSQIAEPVDGSPLRRPPSAHATPPGRIARSRAAGPPPLPAVLGIAVVTADDLLGQRVRSALEREGLVAHVELGGGAELEPERLTRRPDVVVLAGPDPDALAPCAHRIRRRLPEVHVVLVVGAGTRPSTRQLLDAGVDGIVLDADLEATLAIVVRAVCAGHLTLPRAMRHAVEAPAFSHRERQILRLVVAGLTNEQIASTLYLAKSTVAGHLTLIFRALGVRSRSEAVGLILAGDESLRASVLGPDAVGDAEGAV